MTATPVSIYASRNSASIIACVDHSAQAQNVAEFGASLASLLDRPLMLYHVVEASHEPGSRQDPLEWNLRRQQAHRHLRRLREALPPGLVSVQVAVGEGDRVQEICDKAAAEDSILIIGASGDGQQLQFRERTAQRVARVGVAPVVLIPKGYHFSADAFSRIMVPHDGSSFSDSALVEAVRLASKASAELLLTHVVPDAGLTIFGLPKTDDLALRSRINERNQMAACEFLERISRKVADQGVHVRSNCLTGDTRTTLQHAIAEEMPSLVVLSARGQGGLHCHDLSIGSTTSYLLDHLVQPVMLVPAAMANVEKPAIPMSRFREPTTSYAA